jgi:hypothetical protein
MLEKYQLQMKYFVRYQASDSVRYRGLPVFFFGSDWLQLSATPYAGEGRHAML